jgi:type I restriction enzyme S subunit
MMSERWPMHPLSALADYINGRAFKPTDWSETGLPIIRIAQITDPNSIPNYYAGTDVDPKHLVAGGDLLFSWSATLAVVKWMHGPAILNQHIFKVVEKPGVSREFLRYLLSNSLDGLAEHSHGSTMKHIRKGVLDLYHVRVPPLPEQRKIADILSSVDYTIEMTRAVIDQLQVVKKAMTQELLTRGIPGRHMRFKKTEMGEVPEAWEVAPLEYVCVRIADGEHISPRIVSHGRPLLSAKHVRENDILFNDMAYVADDDFIKFRRRCDPNPGDVLIVSRGATIGRVHHLQAQEPFCLMGSVIQVRTEHKRISGAFLAYFLKLDSSQRELVRTSGSSAQQAIYLKHIKNLMVTIPAPNEQSEIVRALNAVDGRLHLERQAERALFNCKSALMSVLLTGEVRVTPDPEHTP